MKQLQTVGAHRHNAIVTVVDVQNRSCHPDGESWDDQKARVVPAALVVIADVIGRARAVGIPVIYIQSVRTHLEPEVTVFGYKKGMQIGSWDVEIAEPVKPAPGDHVVQKFSHDAFFRTDLDAVLATLVPDPTTCYSFVVGGATNLCVYHAVMGYYLRNYWTCVVADGVYCRTDEARERAFLQFSDRSYPNIFLTRSDLIEFSNDTALAGPRPVPGK
jgi:nicotinamidase-related amidase